MRKFERMTQAPLTGAPAVLYDAVLCKHLPTAPLAMRALRKRASLAARLRCWGRAL